MAKTYNILDISKIIGNITKELSILSGKLLKGKKYRCIWKIFR